MKKIALVLALVFFSATVLADQRVRPDGLGGWVIQDDGGCGGMYGVSQAECDLYQRRMPQERNRQQEVIQRQQIENQRLQNELLRRQLERQTSTPAVDDASTPELRSWQAANPWFGTDRPQTEFALLYAKQLRQERPELVGRAFFDAVSAKVNEVFRGK